MQHKTLHRRSLLATASAGALALGSGCAASPDAARPAARGLDAQAPGTPPTTWSDQFGPVANLPRDTDPLVDELAKYPRCRYCGMERAKFSHTRHLLVYNDDSVEGTCSLHCAAISLALNMDRGPKVIYAGDAGSALAIKPLVAVDKAHYVLDPGKPGTMTRTSKFAYADRAAAMAAAATDAAARAGARVVDFNAALTAAYLGMAEDTAMLRQRRGEMRQRMKAMPKA